MESVEAFGSAESPSLSFEVAHGPLNVCHEMFYIQLPHLLGEVGEMLGV